MPGGRDYDFMYLDTSTGEMWPALGDPDSGEEQTQPPMGPGTASSSSSTESPNLNVVVNVPEETEPAQASIERVGASRRVRVTNRNVTPMLQLQRP